MTRKPRRPNPSPIIRVAPVSGLVVAETAVYAALLAGVVLAFSTDLQIQFTLPKLLILRASTAALVIIWIGRFHQGDTQPLPRPVLLASVLLACWWGITTVVAVDPATALEGAHGRFNGLWTNALFLTLFVVTATTRAPQAHLIARVTALVISLVGAAGYTMVQSAGLDVFVWPYSRPASTIGQPVTLATALGLGAPFALVFALSSTRMVARWLWGSAFAALAVGAGLTLSRGPLLAMTASSAIAIFALAAPRVVSRKAIVIAAMLVFVTVASSGAYMVRLRSGRFFPPLTEVTRGPEIRSRLHTLRAAAAMARDHPLFGVGLENYHVLYPRYRPADAERLTPDSLPTMVHSAYLQAAVTTGVVGLALYLIFLGAVLTAHVGAYRRQTERPARLLVAACIASACGFLIADLTGWPEVSTVAIFFFVLGLGLSAAPASGAKGPPSAAIRALVDGAAVAWLVVILLLTIAAVQLVRADHALWRARSIAAVDWPAAQALVDHGLEMAGTRAAYRDAAASLFAERFGVTGDRVLYDRAAILFETAHAWSPFSEWVMIHRIDLETALLQKQKGGTPARAVNEMAAALLAVDLHNGTAYESLARMRLAEGALTPALEMIARAELLRPQQADYWRLEGDIRRAMGDRRAAISAYRHARAGMVAGTAEWLGVDRRLIVTLLEAGDYAEAIDETNNALTLAPGDALLRRLLDAANEAKRTRATES